MSEKLAVITLDGPSGVGKGTISRFLAKKLGWNYLDSGALYRVLALAAHKHAIPFDDESSLSVLARYLDVQFLTRSVGEELVLEVVLEGEDVTEEIRLEWMGQKASEIAPFAQVRQGLLERQRSFATSSGLVADGRDMGTVVFPKAGFKLYLDAAPEIRAQRRLEQLQRMGKRATMDSVFAEILIRDERDTQRQHGPLAKAEDAVLIDTTEMSLSQVTDMVLKVLERKGLNTQSLA